jgi:hypothetical protein
MWEFKLDMLWHKVLYVVVMVLLLWLIAGYWTFAIRHPHLTDVERLGHFKESMLFKRLTPEQLQAIQSR